MVDYLGTRIVDQGGRKKKKLGDLLVSSGAISEEQLLTALDNQKVTGKKLGESLIDLGYITDRDIAEALHRQLGIDMITLADITIADEILQLVKESVLRKYNVIPIEYSIFNMNELRVAMSDPMDIYAIDDLSFLTNMQIEPVVSTPSDIRNALDKYFGNNEAMQAAEKFAKEQEERKSSIKKEETINLEDEINNAPIVQLVNKIIEQAVRQRASDIHIEPMEYQVRIRYRVDGVLKTVMNYGTELLSAITTRIKIVGGMDISEKRKPQDGRITQVVDRNEFDIRVSVLPTVYGEKVVMRLTSKQGLTRDKKELGFNEEELAAFDSILKHPHGIILVTGPTGSGKSTTLYTALSELNVDGVNIITVEDPVEANIDGINQVQVNNKADMTFANALRSILRQDPDIIMIGEIRDGETAEIAVKASITGHLVVSTLHTNSAASTITRLEDMGIESYLIADSVIGVIAQRLVRRLCPKCKKPRMATPLEKEMLGYPREHQLEVYEPCGCQQCNDTGFMGRIGVYEIMTITPKLKEVISRKGSADDIKRIALAEGMHTLKMSASKFVIDGTTSMSEMQRIAYEQ